MTLNHTDIANGIQAILVANTTPVFEAVFPGEPLGLPLGGPYAAFWYLGRSDPPEGRKTWGNIMLVSRWQLACYWLRQPERSTLEAYEVAIADADQALRTALRADSTLGEEATDLEITDSEVGYGRFPLGKSPSAHYRALGFEMQWTDLEGEAIAR